MFEPPRRRACSNLSRGALPVRRNPLVPDPVVRGASARPRARRRRTGAVALVLLVALPVLAACSGEDDSRATGTTSTSTPDPAAVPGADPATDPTAPATLPISDDFIAPDTRNVRIQPVLSKPKEPIDHTKPILAVEGGDAKLHGRVFAPEDEIEGALVRLERFVGEDFGVLDVPVRKDGTWEAKDIRGGRYRLRAFKRPAWATTEPQAYFLPADKGEGNVDLAMEHHDGLLLQGALELAEPHVGEKATLRVLLLEEEVAEDGVVRGLGIPAAEVVVSLLGGVAVVGSQVTTTDENGVAGFTVLCTEEGIHGVNLTSTGLTTFVELPHCGPGEVNPADLNPDGTDTFPVGSTFTVPRDEVLPPGTYQATSPGNCGTTFEYFADNRWSASLALERTMVMKNPIRMLRPLVGTKPCSYERTA